MRMTNRTQRRLTTAAIAGVSIALMMTGCAAPSTNGGDASEARELTTRAPGGEKPVDHISWNLPNGEPPTLDPRNTADYSGVGVVSNLCDTLLVLDENYKIGPNLVSWEQVTPTQVVMTLRADAKFWDGKPVTPEDIVYSLQRASAEDSIVAFYFANVKSMQAISDTEVQINFTQTDVLFEAAMATFGGMVTEKEFTEKAGDAFGSSSGGLMCSGPYKLDSWTPGNTIELSKNEQYWNDQVPRHADAVTFRFISDSTAATQALTAGEIDGSYEIPASSIPALEKADAGKLYFGESMQSISLAVARPDGPLANLDLRAAFQTMIDREALADVVFHGAATPLFTSLTPASWPAEESEQKQYQAAYDAWTKKRGFDLESAKELVKKSGYDGAPVVLGIPAGDDTQGRIAQLVQQQAKAAGVEIKITELQPLEATQAAYDASVRQKYNLDLMIGASFNAAHEPLEPMSLEVIPDSPYNYTEFTDPEAQDLAARALQTIDGGERAKLTLQLQEILESDDGTVPLVSTNTVTYLNTRLGGAVTSFAYFSMPSMAYIGGN